MRRILLVALGIFVGGPAAADITLEDLSAYLNSFETAKAGFTQISSDGAVSTGELFIKRPGRVRFEYTPPDDTLVLASGGQLAIFDGKSNMPPEQYPLRRTPLHLILGRDVDLLAADLVQGFASNDDSAVVIARDPERPEYGMIELHFTADPVELRQWIIVDEAGGRTTIVLGALETGLRLRNGMFNIVTEANARGLD